MCDPTNEKGVAAKHPHPQMSLAVVALPRIAQRALQYSNARRPNTTARGDHVEQHLNMSAKSLPSFPIFPKSGIVLVCICNL